MRKCGVPPADRGFTLIELLCVIVIIMIIVSMALPAYSNFRDKGDGVTCSSNLRQIAAALQAYVGQNDNTFPQIEPNPNQPIYTPPQQGILNTLSPYGLTAGVVQCPADVRLPQFNYYKKWGTSYMWQPYIDDELQSAPQLFTRRGQIGVPLGKIIVCFDVEQVHGIHSNFVSKKNYLYADGHVRNYWDTAPRTRPKN
jgi:prepilin-type N-terminal cleavage/methylation domain-containing protein/prepilin-type processing-associated H-X9-DG protein